MKTFAVLAAVATFALIMYSAFPPQTDNDAQFQTFINSYGRNFASVDEYNMRREIFNKQLDIINEHNAKGLSWTLGVNEFTDWTDEEYKKLLGLRASEGQNSALPIMQFPKLQDGDIDWRNVAGYVGPVLNQGHCGSCWAFSAAQAFASSYFKKFGNQVEASRSQLVDCDFFSHGCNGGLQENGFVHWMRHSAIYEEKYPYQPMDRDCQENRIPGDLPLLPFAFRVDVGDDLLYDALTHQPVSISIRAENPIFRSYTGGIIDGDDCGVTIDHAVLLVGYNENENYWIVKNSWGPDWGESGYVRIKRRDGKGICGINQQNSVPVYENDFF
jgi:hypothetical protein